MSLLTSPKTTGCKGPESIDTCTPLGWILQVAIPFTRGVKPHPKLGAVPGSPPITGVSIDPNGLVAVLLLTTIVLLITGVPYALALGLIVAILDLIPLAGATLAAIIVSVVGFLHSTTAGIVLVIFFVLYQQLENHVLQPLVYGRTVQLSPLIVLIAVLMGAELAGVIGALGAIPVAGAIQVIVLDWLDHRRLKILDPPGPLPSAVDLPS